MIFLSLVQIEGKCFPQNSIPYFSKAIWQILGLANLAVVHDLLPPLLAHLRRAPLESRGDCTGPALAGAAAAPLALPGRPARPARPAATGLCCVSLITRGVSSQYCRQPQPVLAAGWAFLASRQYHPCYPLALHTYTVGSYFLQNQPARILLRKFSFSHKFSHRILCK